MADYDWRDVRLTDINKVISFMNKIVNEVRKGITDDKAARTQLYASQLLITAFEKRDQVARLDELEAMVAKLEGERMRG